MNPARPGPGALLAKLEDIPDASARAFDFTHDDKRYSLILARSGDAVFAYENRCAHAAYPLERPDGAVLVQSGRYLVCAMHGASFELATGACAGGPCNGRGLTPVVIRVEANAVWMA